MANPIVPPFTRASVIAKIRGAEDAWNSHDPARLASSTRPTPIGEPGRVGAGEALSTVTLVPAVKDTLADIHGDASWRRPHPPLRPLTEAERGTLREALAGTEYPRLFGR